MAGQSNVKLERREHDLRSLFRIFCCHFYAKSVHFLSSGVVRHMRICVVTGFAEDFPACFASRKEMVCMKLEAVVLYPSKRDGVDRLQAGSFM